MHKYSIHIACWELESCCHVKRLYSWSSVNIIQTFILCALQKIETHKCLEQYEHEQYSLHYFTAKWMFFTENYFRIQVDSSTSWEHFPQRCWEISRRFFEKNRLVNYFTPTPKNRSQTEIKKYLHFQECSCICNELPGTNLQKINHTTACTCFKNLLKG